MRLRAFPRHDDGTAAIEFCIIAPLLLLLAGGIVEFGRGFEVSNEANRLATQYAIAFADCSDVPAGICGTELASYVAAPTVSNVSPQLKANRFTLAMFQVKMNGSTPQVTYKAPAGAALTAGQITAAQGVIRDGETGVIVSVTYEHRIELMGAVMTPILGSSIQMPYTVVQLKS